MPTFLTVTFAAIDWGMSLEPDWYSTIYGAMLIVGEALATLALMIVVGVVPGRGSAAGGGRDAGRLHDLGNLMLAFVDALGLHVVLAVPDHLERQPDGGDPLVSAPDRGGWQWVALALIVFHFFLPFFVLLFRENKRQRELDRGWLSGSWRCTGSTWSGW